ncbi:MAG: NADP-dependent isocitrate dehydrogenase [Planctomycetota bacterium]|nr:MAG: NADP-dependent isocitrate dehydrogenase [Planctomycetota bacterium]
MEHKIIYTKVDEAPALATYSLLPIFQAFTKGTRICFETKDISLTGRILANFPDYLSAEQQRPDDLAELSELTQKPEANIIKLPNISASIPQLKAAIAELQEKGFPVPNYPEEPTTDEEKHIQQRYSKVLGSAVNPVLRQGNSDRRAPLAVKNYAKKFPQAMGLPLKPWSPQSKTHVAHMENGDFYESENSLTLPQDTQARIEFVDKQGQRQILKPSFPLLKGEVIDTARMSVRALRHFFQAQIQDALQQGLLLSLHLKATMMKVSDPVIFGHCLEVYFEEVFEKYREIFQKINVNPNYGLGDLYKKLQKLPDDQRKEIENAIENTYQHRPPLAMVDSYKGITNLHFPNDIIIDASMPVVIRDGGQMWGPDNQLHDTKALIPDRSYAVVYKEIVENCKKYGAFDRSTMGSVSNVGLMAQKAEEYGSHDKTFCAPADGQIQVLDENNNLLLQQEVEQGDIFRMCQTKDLAIQDWVKLAVQRARATGEPTVFWLDENRAHDAQLIQKVQTYLKNHNTEGLEIHIKSPVEAMRFSLERIRAGKNTIAVTGNVLRDYLTDLFPILELGTSAKMLSIVRLLHGGGLFETGAGGSAPKHVQQFIKENHLRWDSLGEYAAVGACFEHIFEKSQYLPAKVFANTLNQAIAQYLENKKFPSRKVHEIDNRGSNFYLALYWAQALAQQNEEPNLKEKFQKIYNQLQENETTIHQELLAVQGQPADMNGYYHPDPERLRQLMRPSPTLNRILDSI